MILNSSLIAAALGRNILLAVDIISSLNKVSASLVDVSAKFWVASTTEQFLFLNTFSHSIILFENTGFLKAIHASSINKKAGCPLSLKSILRNK